MSIKNLRVALVYDWVNTRHGGAEQVLISLQKLFPDAPLYTSVYDKRQATWADSFEVRPSRLQFFPFSSCFHREYLPLMPWAFSTLNLDEFDIVISVTSAQAKGITVGPKTLHVCYLLTPTRYLWSHTLEYQKGLLQPLKTVVCSVMRVWDYWASQKPDIIIPISEVVKKRAEKYYRRKIEPVIYPPFQPFEQMVVNPKQEGQYFLVVSRLVDYKKIEIAIQACVAQNQALLIVGDGPNKGALQEKSHLVRFRSGLSSSQLASVYAQAKALLLPAEEDFGLVALEAQSFGIPVIVYSRSGAAEVVIDGETGIHVSEQTAQAFSQAIGIFSQTEWKKQAIQNHSKQYNERVFHNHFLTAVEKQFEESKGTL